MGGAATAGDRRSRRRLRALAWLAVLMLAGVVLLLALPAREQGGCVAGSGFGPGNWPSGCWRPYGPRHFMNVPAPRHPRVARGSAAIVARMRSFGDPKDLEAYTDATRTSDFYHPFYFSQPGDPTYVITTDTPWRCHIQGAQVRIPEGAQPAQGSDRHMAVIDEANDREYDMWNVQPGPLPAGGGSIHVGCGGITTFNTARSLYGGATAGGWGLLAGVIRSDELARGRINHALFATVSCSSGRAVPPAEGLSGGGACPQGRSTAPAIGQWLWLDMSDAAIDRLPAPAWRKVIFHALHRYGAFVGDTGGGRNALGFQFESDETYRSFGAPGHGEQLAERLAGDPSTQVTYRGGIYRFDMASGFPWRRIRVLAPPRRR